MPVRITINGCGRNTLRAFSFYAINDLGSAEINAHPTRFDTTHGKFPGSVVVGGAHVTVRAWYGNEWCFANRPLDNAQAFGALPC